MAARTRDEALRFGTWALTAAMQRDWEEAKAFAERVGEEWMLTVMLAWIDTLLHRRGQRAEGELVELRFVDADTGAVADNADNVSPEVAWAGRLIAARDAGDEETLYALVRTLPQNRTVVGQHVGMLLAVVALSLAAEPPAAAPAYPAIDQTTTS